jgi:hypothetical protein
MGIEFLYLSLTSLLFGLTQKIADDQHDEGIYFFKYSDIVFGLILGIFGFILISYSPILQAVYLGPLLYWIYKGKIDCIQHKIAAVIMFFGVVYSYEYLTASIVPSILIFGGYAIFDGVKKQSSHLRWFFRYRLHFHFVHIIYALFIGSLYGYTPLMFNLIGINIGKKIGLVTQNFSVMKIKPKGEN